MKIAPLSYNVNFSGRKKYANNINFYKENQRNIKNNEENVKFDKQTRRKANIALAAMTALAVSLNSGCAASNTSINETQETSQEYKKDDSLNDSSEIKEEVFEEYDKETGIKEQIKITSKEDEIVDIEVSRYDKDEKLISWSLAKQEDDYFTITRLEFENDDLVYSSKKYFDVFNDEDFYLEKEEVKFNIEPYQDSVFTLYYSKDTEDIDRIIFDVDNDGIPEFKQDFSKDGKPYMLTDENGEFVISSDVQDESKLDYSEIDMETGEFEEYLPPEFDEIYEL